MNCCDLQRPDVADRSHTSTFVVASVHQLLVSLQDPLAKQQEKTFSGAAALVSGADYKVGITGDYSKAGPDGARPM